LKPFPSSISIEYHFHQKAVRTIAVSPNGLYLASGDEDSNVVIWHVRTSKIMRSYKLQNKVIDSVQWNPDPTLCLLIVCNEEHVIVIAPDLYTSKVNDATRALLSQSKDFYESTSVSTDAKDQTVKWTFAKDMKKDEILVTLTFSKVISRLTWHPKGDYFATLAHNFQSTSQVVIHSLRKASSQKPFSQTKGIIQCFAFHPTKPHFFAATHISVFQYNLQMQSIVKKYKSGAKWISSISIHPKGDNLILGTYDKKVLWFDMDMSGEKPYKSLKYHEKAIRDVNFH
jgi:ribosome biogenesis protein ERB1